MWWIVTAVVFLLFAGVAYVAELVFRSDWRQMARLSEMSCADVAALAATAREAGGSFGETVQVNGVTAEGPGGLMTAPLSRRKCVWWEYQVSRVYWREPAEKDDKAQPTRVTEHLGHRHSTDRFLLTDESGSVAVSLGANRPEGTVGSHFADYARSELGSSSRAVPEQVLNAAAKTRDDSRTISYEIREHILTPGVPLFVQGEASDRAGQVVIGRPRRTNAKLIVSVIGRDQLILDKKADQRLARAVRLGLTVIAGLSLFFYLLTLVF
ncbi:hypothetical protein FDA94_31710 [Herbidospora galbida]|uniref:RING-type E3 ubiquitin transferase n=1 Tax=Herbidospora galbida TaxID=2575442 RepID=A0A4V5UYB2_9ACTN|nr:GIDE domain-containing protein [Herbidospora galbida]TKK83933.1 hypothetical protein FDA94_31710 [Herbidospora galbida]